MLFLYESQEHMWRVLNGEIGKFYLELIERIKE